MLEHTADMGIEAKGGSMEALFFAASIGLREIVFGETTEKAGREDLEIELQAGDSAELLVHWLNELLFLMHNRAFFPTDFHFLEMDPDHFRARVSGESGGVDNEAVREVKAVTYHRLSIERRNDHWRARVYVDL
jgi:SHS2 domain-containing protein